MGEADIPIAWTYVPKLKIGDRVTITVPGVIDHEPGIVVGVLFQEGWYRVDRAISGRYGIPEMFYETQLRFDVEFSLIEAAKEADHADD